MDEQQCMNCRWSDGGGNTLLRDVRVVQEGVQPWTTCHVRVRGYDLRYLRDEVQVQVLNNAVTLDGGRGVPVRCSHSCELWEPLVEGGLRGRAAQVEVLRWSGMVTWEGESHFIRHLRHYWSGVEQSDGKPFAMPPVSDRTVA